METGQVVTSGDFVAYLRQTADRAEDYPGALEDYLRSVLGLVIVHRENPATWRLLADILTNALTHAPLEFDPTWLEFTGPPDIVHEPDTDNTDPYEAVQHILRYQIADLHRMDEAGTLDDPWRSYGIDSPTGHRWFNFDKQAFLTCAASGMGGNGMGDGDSTTKCSWADLAIILWLGQIYE